MNSNANFLNTTIEFVSTKKFEESLFQARLQISRLKKEECQKMDQAQAVNKIKVNSPH